MKKRSEKLGFGTIAGLEERRAARRTVGAAEALSVLKADGDWRFHYTIKEIVAHGEVWFVNRPDGTLIDFKFEDHWVSPFWPHEDIAKLACERMEVCAETNPMPLDHWIDAELERNCRSDSCLIALCLSEWSAELKSVDEVFEDLAAYKDDPEAYWKRHFSEDRVLLTQNLKAGPKGRLP